MRINVKLKDLREAGACKEGIRLFRETFGRSVTTDWTYMHYLWLVRVMGHANVNFAVRAGLIPIPSMERATLDNGHIVNLYLAGATFYRANLVGADFRGSNLSGASLDSADARGAIFEHCTMHRVDCSFTNLQGANLVGADLQGAHLNGAILKGAILKGADLQGANLQGADLREAELRGADFEGANLRGANLEGANLQGASLEGADFEGANLKEVRGMNG